MYQFSSVMVDLECEVSWQGEHGLGGEDLVGVVQHGVEHVVRTLLDVSRKFQCLQQKYWTLKETRSKYINKP